MHLRIASYNVLNNVHATTYKTKAPDKTPLNNWDTGRKERVFNCIRAVKADIVCLQEVCRSAWRQLKAAGFEVTKLAINENRKGIDEPPYCEGPCMVYNPATVTVVSDTLIFAEKKFYSSVVFDEKSTGCRVHVVSMHPKGYGNFQQDPEQRLKEKSLGYNSLRAMLSTVEKSGTNPDLFVIAGDMNEDQHEIGRYPAETTADQGCLRHKLMQDLKYSETRTVGTHHGGGEADDRGAKKVESKTLETSETSETSKTLGHTPTLFGDGSRKLDWIYFKTNSDKPEMQRLCVANNLLEPGIRDSAASDHAIILSVFRTI